ncbi:hypothetical protein BSR29_04970 [Boudabousia liubingyangii]|uniref:DNA helicase n=1 Tax=Boudabousia liubingyangii TaxID=1921764 RepID=A0A1Q5PLF1_9ACTO|nr:hypothetical protein [Boudabousia liubingyangii]OKL47847.1 hypothetical protein BSR29_04970 [Boudabousia liubingyangii]
MSEQNENEVQAAQGANDPELSESVVPAEETFGQRIARERAEQAPEQAPKTRFGKAARLLAKKDSKKAAAEAKKAASADLDEQGVEASSEAENVDSAENPEATETPQKIYDFVSQVGTWRKEVKQLRSEQKGTARLHLTYAHPTGLAQLYGGKPVRLTNIFRETAAHALAVDQVEKLLDASAREAARFGTARLELGFGLVTAPEFENPLPVLLRGIQISSEATDYSLTLLPGLRLNPEFLNLAAAYGIEVPEDELLDACWSQFGFTPSGAFEMLPQLLAQAGPGTVKFNEDLVVSIFEDPLAAVLAQLKATSNLEESEILRALAGQESARKHLGAEVNLGKLTDPDPDQEVGIGDLTPQDQGILKAAQSGRSFLVGVGPGASPSTLLAAMAVAQVQAGHQVTYASTDISSAYALVHALEDHGLGRWVANLADGQGWPQILSEQLSRILEEAGPHAEAVKQAVAEADTEELVPLLDERGNPTEMPVAQLRAELRETRKSLQDFTSYLHQKHQPWDISAYESLQVLADLIGMHPAPRTKVRFPASVCNQIFADGGQAAREALDDAAALGLFSSANVGDPWSGAMIRDAEQVEPVLAAVKRLSEDLLPKLRVQVSAAVSETGLHAANSFAQWREQLDLLERIRETLDVFLPIVFERSAADMIIATATPQWRRDHGQVMKGSLRRRLTKSAKELLRPGRSDHDLHEQLVRAQKQRNQWTEYSEAGGWPRIPSELEEMQALAKQIASDLELLQGAFETEAPLEQIGISQLIELVERLNKEPSGAYTQPALVEIRQRLQALGLTEFVTDIRNRAVVPELIVAELDLAWWASALNLILSAEGGFQALEGPVLDSLTASLRRLDRAQTRSLTAAAGKLFRDRCNQVILENADELEGALLSLEAGDQGHVEATLRSYPWLTKLLPVWIIPPVLATQLTSGKGALPIETLLLDRVEGVSAGQFVPILSRAQQVLAFGDEHRGTDGLWSSLLAALPLVSAGLGRTRTHLAISALLAKYGYHHGSIPVPVPRCEPSVNLITVDGRGMPAMDVPYVESTQVEVQRVVDLVIEHALTHADQSLAVCATNARHGQYLREAILRAVAGSLAVDDFFRTDKAEPFVVVDPSTPAGLERDRVILSLGFGKTPHGRILHDFGALSKPDGEKLLASLLAVSRHELTVVSSFDLSELDLNRLKAPGEQLMVDLMHLGSGGDIQGSAGWSTVGHAPDRLLVDLAERLFRTGLEVVPNLGVEGGYRIPLAIGHPDVPGELLVAVLTDDADYVNEPSLRVSERHDVERLEACGWLVKRVYSTAAFVGPQAEADALVELVLDAVDLRLGLVMGQEPEVEDTTPTIVPPADIAAWEAGDDQQEQGDAAGEGAVAPSATENADGLAGAEAGDGQYVANLADANGEGPQSESADSAETADPAAENTDHDDEVAAAPKLVNTLFARERGPRPAIATGLPLAAYSDEQLAQMLRWVASDGRERTEDEYILALHRALGLTRTGRQVNAVLGFTVRSLAAELHLVPLEESDEL